MAKVHEYSDSVFCLKRMSARGVAAERWEWQMVDFQRTVSNQELFAVDGEPFDFEWN